MLEEVDGLVPERGLVSDGEVPAEDDSDEERPRDERPKEVAEGAADERGLEYGDGDAPAERPGDASHERDDGRADLDGRDGEEHEQHVLSHVREEELVRKCVEGADEGDEEGDEPDVERRGAAFVVDTPSLEAAQATRVEDRGERYADEGGGVSAPGEPEGVVHGVPPVSWGGRLMHMGAR